MRLSLTELIELFAWHDVSELLVRCRGRRIYLSSCETRARAQLQRRFALAGHLARPLAAHYAGQEITFPRATPVLRTWAVQRLQSMGLSVTEMALVMNISPRTVSRALSAPAFPRAAPHAVDTTAD